MRLILLMAALLTPIWVASCKPDRRAADVPSFATPAWENMQYLQIRSESPGSDVLLLRNSERYPLSDDDEQEANVRRAVYQLDTGAGKLRLVGSEMWDRATGTICDCGGQFATLTHMTVNWRKLELKLGAQVVPTAGRYVMSLVSTPQGDLVAVVSAKGPRGISFIPSMGGGVGGIRYHQVFRTRNAQPVGDPVRLPMGSEGVAVNGCWSSDQAYIVYTDGKFSEVCVIPVKAPGSGSK